MRYLFATKVLSGTGGESMYIPVPRRGIVKAMTVACNVTMVATGKLIAYRGATDVNTATAPTGDTAAGTVLVGKPETDDKDLIFDPDSDTVANKVIKITDDDTLLGGAGTVVVMIKYDDSASVEQAASES